MRQRIMRGHSKLFKGEKHDMRCCQESNSLGAKRMLVKAVGVLLC